MNSRVDSPGSFSFVPSLLVLAAIAWLLLHPFSPLFILAPDRSEILRPSSPLEKIEATPVDQSPERARLDLSTRIDPESVAPAAALTLAREARTS